MPRIFIGFRKIEPIRMRGFVCKISMTKGVYKHYPQQGFQKGKDNINWKDGKTKHSTGYILIRQPKHPTCTKNGYVFEHRLVVEEYLGRYLTKMERIHHINEKLDDNRLKNLYLFPNIESHTSYHILLKNNLIIEPITKSNLTPSI